MTGTQRTLTIAFLLVLTAGASACAGEFPQAERYFAARDSSRVTSVPFDAVRLRPQEYRSSLIEIRGTVTGTARRDDGATVIITGTGGPWVVEVTGGTATGVDAGQTVRILARVPEGIVVSRLTAICVASEFEAASFEAQRTRRAALAAAAPPKPKPVARRPARRQLASRGGMAVRSASVIEQYAQAVLYFNRRLSWDSAVRLAHSIISYSHRYGLDARLVMAVIAVESNFNAGAVSPKGAMGLGQLMPGTAADLGVGDPWSPEQNIEGSTRLLSGHLSRMSVTRPTEEAIGLALACYNAGAGAVKKYKGIPPYRETKNYVRKVTRLYYQMCGQPVPPDAAAD